MKQHRLKTNNFDINPKAAMMKLFTILLIIGICQVANSQTEAPKIQMGKNEFAGYHLKEHLLADTVMSYYSQFWYKLDSVNLNESQRSACIFAIFTELSSQQGIRKSLGLYNELYFDYFLPEYMKLNDSNEMAIALLELQIIYLEYQEYFESNGLPPVLTSGSESFNQELDDRIDIIEAIIIDYSFPNNISFYCDFIDDNKLQLLSIEN